MQVLDSPDFEQERPVEYAGFWLRFVAAIIDGALLSIVNGLLLYSRSFDFSEGGALTSLLEIAVPWLYYAGMESFTNQATLGKMALGLKVTDMAGQRVTFLRATGRHFGKILSALILLFGFIMAGFTQRKQALHDILAECLVVKK